MVESCLGIINVAIVVAVLLLIGAIILWFLFVDGYGGAGQRAEGLYRRGSADRASIMIVALLLGHTFGSHHRRTAEADAGMSTFWPVPREWEGETVFIVGGGPSVLGVDLEVLRGRRVIVINSSVYAVPWADFLYFGDWRWWNEPENQAAVASFAGRVVTVSRMVSEARRCWSAARPIRRGSRASATA